MRRRHDVISQEARLDCGLFIARIIVPHEFYNGR